MQTPSDTPRFGFPVFRRGTPTTCSWPSALALLVGVTLLPWSASAQPAAQARQSLAEGRTIEALLFVVDLFATNPGSPEGRRLLWELVRGAPTDPDLVEIIADNAEKLGPEGPVAAGVLLRRALRPLDALEAFDQADKRRMANLEAGWLLAELRLDDRALQRFERVRGDPAALYGHASIFAREGRTAEALVIVEELLAGDPDNAAGTLLRAELLDSSGRTEEAIRVLRDVLARSGLQDPAALRLARILVKEGSAPEAVPLLESILAIAPENAAAWLSLAEAHEGAARTAAATEAFRRALATGPDLNEARLGLARLLARDGQREAAAPLFAEFERRKAVADESSRLLGEAELRPDDFRRVQAFVVHALSRGDFGLALRGAQRFLIESPEDPERHLLVARVFREGGSRADAERVLRRGIDRFAGDEAAVRRFEAGLRAIAAR